MAAAQPSRSSGRTSSTSSGCRCPIIDRRFLAGLRRIAPLVLTVHDTNPFNGDPSSGLQGLGMAHAFGAFDRLIVHTARGRERLLQHGADPARVVIAPHGPLGKPAPARADDPMDGVITFLMFGKIKPYKGIPLLIEAFPGFPTAARQARLRVVGKPYMDSSPCASLRRNGGVEPGLEPRFVPDEELPALFGPGTVAVFPYREIEASGVLTLALRMAADHRVPHRRFRRDDRRWRAWGAG